jgi:hydrogenase maturation factor
MMNPFPVGKLPHRELERLLARLPAHDRRLIQGPGTGFDCAVLDFGDRLLVVASDPITFTAQDIGWYAVQVNANDVATSGAAPRWFMATVLLPEGRATRQMADQIMDQMAGACRNLGVDLIGGHTEITAGLDRPILAGTMLGEISPAGLITPRGAQPGHLLALTKGIPLEACSILASEFADRLEHLPQELLERARNFLRQPGISIVPEALAAARSGGVTAMHDPTEGGLAAALWELARAAGLGLEVHAEKIPILREGRALCGAMGIDPLSAIASGALLLCVKPDRWPQVREAVEGLGIPIQIIGQAVPEPGVRIVGAEGTRELAWPARDAIAALFED